MNLQYSELSNENSQVIRGPVLLKPKIFGDDRGFFYESWNQEIFNNAVGEEVNSNLSVLGANNTFLNCL